MTEEQEQRTREICALTQAIEDARHAVETQDTLVTRARLKDVQIAYRDYLLGLNGLARA